MLDQQDKMLNFRRNLGGKLGASVIEKFGIETMAQLASISLEALKEAYKSKTA